jgi:hypothetical protein
MNSNKRIEKVLDFELIKEQFKLQKYLLNDIKDNFKNIIQYSLCQTNPNYSKKYTVK